MAELDLQTALSMFQDSTKQLMLSRAISGANDQVNQIRASEASEQDKRAQLQSISNNLVAHMASLGTPATTMQEVAGALGPKQYANAADMYKQGQLTGNSQLQDMAKQQQKFEEDPEMKKLQVMLQLGQNKMGSKQDELFTKHMTDVNNKIDPNTSRFGNLAKLQGVNLQIGTVAPLLDDLTKWTPTAMDETIRKLDAAMSQGASTVTGAHNLSPKMEAKYAAETRQLISNRPENMAGAAEWQKYFKEIFSRIKDINSEQIKEGQLNYVQGEASALMRQFPDRIQDVESALSNKIGEPVVIDKKSGNVDLASNVQKQDMYAEAIKKAAANPGDVRINNVLQAIGGDDRNLRRVFLRYPELRKTYQELSKLHK